MFPPLMDTNGIKSFLKSLILVAMIVIYCIKSASEMWIMEGRLTLILAEYQVTEALQDNKKNKLGYHNT